MNLKEIPLTEEEIIEHLKVFADIDRAIESIGVYDDQTEKKNTAGRKKDSSKTIGKTCSKK